MNKIELTEKGKMVLECLFASGEDTVKDVKLNHFPERTEEEIILSLNAIGEVDNFDATGFMEVFFKGIDYGRRK